MEVISEGKKRDSIATRAKDRRRRKRDKEITIEDEEDPELALILNED